MNNLLQPILQKQSRMLQLASRRINKGSIQKFSIAKTFHIERATTWQMNTNTIPTRSLSSAAVTSDIPSTRKKRRVDPLIVTENAAFRIKELLAGENAKGALGIRLGVKRRGCNGLSYTLNYAFEIPDKDEVMEAHGIKVFIEPMALFNVVGTIMDYEETELASEFTFNNPNSKGECGCGESFNV